MIDILKAQLSLELANGIQLPKEQIYQLLENPKSIEHGHLAFPVFMLAKELKKAPPLIAQELKAKFDGKISHVEQITAVGGYLNFTFDLIYLQNLLSHAVADSASGKVRLGYQKPKAERVVIDYSSPNVAKPMSIGHLRATMIGQAVRNLAESQGYQVTGLNYLGDWGVQFGKLAYAYSEWEGGKNKNYDFTQKPFEALYQLYVDFHKAAEENPELDAKGSLTFKRLEEGDKEIEKIWKMFLDISLNEYKRIYGLLNVNFDLIQGESFYNDKLESTVELINKKGLLTESDGAQVVFLDDDMPPCIIKKSDGASLYATRDIASAIHRHDGMKGDHLLYVVGVDQNLHFRQVFKVLEKMGYDWAKNCHHVAFGMYRFKDIGKMSTRKGNVIFMDDVLNKSIELAEKIIEEKNPDLSDKKLIAQQVGVGAIVFNDLSSDRIKNVDFDWDRVLDFEGDSGPYVQYCAVRCKSILRKFEGRIPVDTEVPLVSSEEKTLVKQLLLYPEILSISYKNFKPSFLAQYLLEVCKAFGSFYTHNKILDDNLDEKTKLARLRLVQCTETLLTEGLRTLGIQSPQKM
ncbi:MAG: arginine--tRNA ligase [Bdellovibrionota bacterium]